MLSRDQYQPPSPFVRRAPLGFQLDDMFFRYLLEQYSVGGPGFLGRLLRAAPLLAAAMGGLWQWRRDRRGFVLVGTTLFFTSLFLVFYLNFTMQEVRPRDYFFSMAFQFLPIWAGLGLAELGLLLASSMRRFRPLAAVAPPLLGVVFALFVGWHGFASHDRSRHTFARDLAHNSLVALPRSSILFTNGDNDTFPLWYAQLVEKQRQDVRVVNLALLNTPWYLKQLRDGYPEPAVPLRLTDAEIDAMRPRMAEGIGPLSVADQAVYEILAANAWQRPVYAAMTVPENHWRRIGLGDRQVIEGITLRFSRDKVERRCDAERTMTVMDQLYRYGGIVGEGGARARRLDVDPDTEGLVQNYGAAYYAAGLEFTAVDSLEAAARAFERANVFAPDIPRVPTALAAMYLETMKLAQAEAVLMDALARWPKSPDLNKLQGDLYGLRDDLARALAQYRRTIELDPNYREAYLLSYHILKRQGLTGEAVAVLRDLLTVMPGDETARRYLSELEAQGG
jgi:tetratricopeptide (TPR) repeat protein